MSSHGARIRAAADQFQPRHTKKRDQSQHDVLVMERSDAETRLDATYLEMSMLDPTEEIQLVRSGVPACRPR